jgi:hypothetical protein
MKKGASFGVMAFFILLLVFFVFVAFLMLKLDGNLSQSAVSLKNIFN